MSFSILWSVSTGPFFIYLLYLFSPQNDDIFYVIRNSIFLLIEIFLKLELESNLNNWAKCCSDLSLKKKCIVLKGKKLFFSVKQPCHRTSSNFILSMFSRKIYSKFYVVFTTYKNAKIKKIKTSWKIWCKEVFLRLQLNWLLFFYLFF